MKAEKVEQADQKMEQVHWESSEEAEVERQQLEVLHVPDWAPLESAVAEVEHGSVVEEVLLMPFSRPGRGVVR